MVYTWVRQVKLDSWREL